ncbi:hypothetical protein PINS_up005466 [Pythium insidiosum]|nr:hypothetical protein PINS_up005466 [Pythium insidiosum]
MLSASLGTVSPAVVDELAKSSIAPPDDASIPRTLRLPTGQSVSASLALNPTLDKALARVPYPAWVVRVVFAVCGVWLAAMGAVTVYYSLQLGFATAGRLVLAWTLGTLVHLVVLEPAAVFALILWSTLEQWWNATLLGRVWRYGRRALRIEPSAEAAYYASLSLYERIRFNAAVRVQRRLLTRLARRRYLQRLRELREAAHRDLLRRRRETLKQAIDGFTEEEIHAFHLLFQDADTARLGLVSYTVISQSIYQLGVHVSPELVRSFLLELDPAYAELVDFEHFLYGMHRVRRFHQQEQQQLEDAQRLAADERAAAALRKEQFVSSSVRFGPQADPHAKVLVKRQNVLRELKEKRDSLSFKLMSKVGKLPPILQRGRSTRTPAEGGATDDESVVNTSTNISSSEEPPPSGTYVLLQSRKLSPKKRALEMVLKKKSREEKARAASTDAPRSPTQRARELVQSWRKPGSPRKRQSPDDRAFFSPIAEETDESSMVAAALPGSVPDEAQDAEDVSLVDEIDRAYEAKSPPATPSADKLTPALVTARSEPEAARPTAPVPSESTVGILSTESTVDLSAETAGKQPLTQDRQATTSEAPANGAFALLHKSSGKAKVMEMLAQRGGKVSSERPSTAASEGDAEDASESTSRPSSSERKERAQAIAKNSLEKALKKKSAAMTAPPKPKQ